MKGQTASAAARAALLVFIRREPKPEKSKATSNDKSNPTHPLRHRPISDDYWPVLKNSHQVEQRHQGEDYPGHHKICFPVHERSSQVRVAAIHGEQAICISLCLA